MRDFGLDSIQYLIGINCTNPPPGSAVTTRGAGIFFIILPSLRDWGGCLMNYFAIPLSISRYGAETKWIGRIH